jgi:hypothetical protein
VNCVFEDSVVKVLLLITYRRSLYDVNVKKYVSVGEQLFCFCISVICALLLLMNERGSGGIRETLRKMSAK